MVLSWTYLFVARRMGVEGDDVDMGGCSAYRKAGWFLNEDCEVVVFEGCGRVLVKGAIVFGE